jgi:hypothetical protein
MENPSFPISFFLVFPGSGTLSKRKEGIWICHGDPSPGKAGVKKLGIEKEPRHKTRLSF